MDFNAFTDIIGEDFADQRMSDLVDLAVAHIADTFESGSREEQFTLIGKLAPYIFKREAEHDQMAARLEEIRAELREMVSDAWSLPAVDPRTQQL